LISCHFRFQPPRHAFAAAIISFRFIIFAVSISYFTPFTFQHFRLPLARCHLIFAVSPLFHFADFIFFFHFHIFACDASASRFAAALAASRQRAADAAVAYAIDCCR